MAACQVRSSLAIWRLVEQVAVALQGGGIAEAVGQGAFPRLFPHGAAMLQGEASALSVETRPFVERGLAAAQADAAAEVTAARVLGLVQHLLEVEGVHESAGCLAAYRGVISAEHLRTADEPRRLPLIGEAEPVHGAPMGDASGQIPMAHHQPADGLGIPLRQLGVDVHLASDL